MARGFAFPGKTTAWVQDCFERGQAVCERRGGCWWYVWMRKDMVAVYVVVECVVAVVCVVVV